MLTSWEYSDFGEVLVLAGRRGRRLCLCYQLGDLGVWLVIKANGVSTCGWVYEGKFDGVDYSVWHKTTVKSYCTFPTLDIYCELL